MSKRIIDVLRNKRTLTFEVFPPNKEHDKDLDIIFGTIKKLTELSPDFISVTYGAGGGNKGRVVDIANFIQNELGSTALAHLTSVGYLKEDITHILNQFHSIGVQNILALRGDLPDGVTFPQGAWKDFRYATDLIRYIKADGRFCIGAAAYPEGHIECKNLSITIEHMKEKIDTGADFFITQLFFENDNFYRFMELVENAGITTPVIVGIMPVLRAKQIKRITQLSGAYVPLSLKKILQKYEDKPQEMEKAGLEYALKQIRDLIEHGVCGVHLYTMNKAEQSCQLLDKLGLVPLQNS